MAVLSLMKQVGNVGKGQWFGVAEAPETMGTYSFQASIESKTSRASPATAVVNIYGANNQNFPILLMTFTLSGAYSGNPITDADRDNFPFAYYMAEVVSLTNGALVSVDVRV